MTPTRVSLLRGVLLGAFLTALMPLAGGLAIARLGLMPVHADAAPLELEKTVAGWVLHRAVSRHASTDPPLRMPTDDEILKGMRLYQENCIVCHGGSKADVPGYSLYPPAPRFSDVGTHLTEEEVAWVARHGIRLTGMPSFGQTLSDDDIREVAGFVHRMHALPPAVAQHWNPKARP